MAEYPTECMYCGKQMYADTDKDPYLICGECEKKLKKAMENEEKELQ